MAQRNPMNDRYQGDGPGGQTRKSAARAKPIKQAASTVHIKKKPQTPAEKRAARKAREKEEAAKAAEKARRAQEKAKAEAAEAAGTAVAKTGDSGLAKPAEQPKSLLGKLFAPNPNAPTTEEYKKWGRIYWMLIVGGIGFLAISFLTQSYLAQSPSWMVLIGGAYACIIGAFVVDLRKRRPLLREHQKQSIGNKSPKQLKHEQEARERAAAIEAARKAAKESKRGPRRKKKNDAIVPGEEQ
jgi:hypothetical protein